MGGAVRPGKEFVHRYGPWALVAGASAGLGAAFAAELAVRGLSLVLVARRGDLLDHLAAEVRDRFSVEVRTAALDLGEAGMLEKVGRLTADLEIGLVVYNAAYADKGALLERDLPSLLKVIDVNCRAPLSIVHHFGRAMQERRRGGILLMSSLTSFNGSPYISTYGASKAFNLVLAEGLSYELRGSGVDVVACCAGATRTPGYESSASRSGFRPPEMTPEEVARAAVRGLGRKSVVIPGGLNRFFSFIMRRFLSRRATVGLMGASVRGLNLHS